MAEFYAEVMALLAELGVPTTMWPVPVEIEGAIARLVAAVEIVSAADYFRATKAVAADPAARSGTSNAVPVP